MVLGGGGVRYGAGQGEGSGMVLGRGGVRYGVG